MILNREKLYRILNPKSTQTPLKLFTSRKRAKRLKSKGRATIDAAKRTVTYTASS